MSATDKTYVGNLVRNLTVGDKQEAYTRVSIHVGIQEDGADLVIVSPREQSDDETGLTLNIENEWGTQEMADAILEQIRGWRYQPYTATQAMLDPASELGDGITVGGIYSGIYKRSTDFDNVMLATISAPSEEEIIHELGFEPTTEKKFEKAINAQRAAIAIQAGKISAEVERRDELETQISALEVSNGEISASVSRKLDSSSPASTTFGWTLLNDSWHIYADRAEVLRATKDGLKVNGEIRAKSGYIGSDYAGFVISDNAIYRWTKKITDTDTGISNNEDILIWDTDDLDHIIETTPENETYGVYIGTDGIRLGQNFAVTPSGKVTATSGEFDGTIRCDALYVKNGDNYEAVATNQMVTSLASGWALSRASLEKNSTPLKRFNSEYVTATHGNFTNIVVSGSYTITDPDTGSTVSRHGGITMLEKEDSTSTKTVTNWAEIGKYISFEDIQDVPEVLGNVAWDNVIGKPFSIQSSGETDYVKVTDGKDFVVEGYLQARGALSSTGVTINTITSNNGQTVSGGTLLAQGKITANGGLSIKNGQTFSFNNETVSSWDDIRALVSRDEQVVTATWSTLSGNPFTTTDGGDGVSTTATGGTLQASTLKSDSIFLNGEVITSWSALGNKIQIPYSQITDVPDFKDSRFNTNGNIVEVAGSKLFAVDGSIAARGGLTIFSGQSFIFDGKASNTWSQLGGNISYNDLQDKPTDANRKLPWSSISGNPFTIASNNSEVSLSNRALSVNSTVTANSFSLGTDSISKWSDIAGKISYNDLKDIPSSGAIKWSDITDAPFSYGKEVVSVLNNKSLTVNATVMANNFSLGTDSISKWSDIAKKITYTDIPNISDLVPFTESVVNGTQCIVPDKYLLANKGVSASSIYCSGSLTIASGQNLNFNGVAVNTWQKLAQQLSYTDLKNKPAISDSRFTNTTVNGVTSVVVASTRNFQVDGDLQANRKLTIGSRGSITLGGVTISQWSDLNTGGGSGNLLYTDSDALGWYPVIRANGTLNLSDYGLQLGDTVYDSWETIITDTANKASNLVSFPTLYPVQIMVPVNNGRGGWVTAVVTVYSPNGIGDIIS